MSKIQVVLFAVALLLAGCSTLPGLPGASEEKAPACPACAACPACPAVETPVQPPAFSRVFTPASWADLPGWATDNHAAAWPAFVQSCRGLQRRNTGQFWRDICAGINAVDGKSDAAVRQFFEARLQPYAVSTADTSAVSGMVTGYYEPLLLGSRSPGKRFAFPVHGVPDNLLTIELGDLFPELKGKRVRGRVEGNRVVPYWTRGDILANDKLPAKTLAWVDDPIELFFLQIQGSGRIRLPDGGTMRVNYADQNGHPYRSIGRLLVERGDLKLEEASMQGIQAWARANPARLDELLNSNPSYVFFREMPASDDGPIGALGVPLTPERSIAIDPRSIPLGVPVFLATTRPNSAQPLNRLVMAQDTGGAIRGAVRIDFFWGFGKEPGALAGRMKQDGRMWVLLPPGHPLD